MTGFGQTVGVGGSRLAGRSSIGEDSAGYLGRGRFAVLGLSEAFVEALVDCFPVAQQPILCCFFGFEEIERVGDEVGGLAKTATLEFTLDAGSGGWIEGQALGGSIPLGLDVGHFTGWEGAAVRSRRSGFGRPRSRGSLRAVGRGGRGRGCRGCSCGG